MNRNEITSLCDDLLIFRETCACIFDFEQEGWEKNQNKLNSGGFGKFSIAEKDTH